MRIIHHLEDASMFKEKVNITNHVAAAVISITLVISSCGPANPQGTSASMPMLSSQVVSHSSALELGSIDPNIDAQIQAAVEEGGMPSLSVGIIVNDELVWAKVYGSTPAGLDTAYMTGSVSKTFTATAIMQLFERGLIDLDADINQYLPFQIRHPAHPDTPITVRMILTHTAGLFRETEDYKRLQLRDRAVQEFIEGYFDLTLDELSFERSYERGEFFEAYLIPGGELYSNEVWSEDLGHFSYSDIGYGLLAYLVEVISGQSFESYLDQNIFQPLELEHTSARVEPLRGTLANPYERIEGSYLMVSFRDIPFYRFCKPYQLICLVRNLFSPIGQVPLPRDIEARLEAGYLRFPVYENLAGNNGVMASVPDLAAYLIAHMNEGRAPNGHQLLEPETMTLMHSLAVSAGGSINYFPMRGYGLGWTLCHGGIQGHIGGALGYGATMLYEETSMGKVGIILLRNWSWNLVMDYEQVLDYGKQYYLPLEQSLLQEAKNMLNSGARSY
jgi:CubicO group peptidase (beta-lactamase class C family)